MYIPIMKNREEELRVLKNMNEFFSDSIIPLLEIIRDEYQAIYQIDKISGDFVYEMKVGNKKKTRVKLNPTDKDIITLEKLIERLNGKKAFIDFFRFAENEYANKTFKGIELSFRLRDFDYYKERLVQVGGFGNLIPVISIKRGFEISEHDLVNLIKELRKGNSSIAIRITDNYLEELSELLEEYLTEADYIMLDIRNQHVDSKFIELEEFQELESPAKKILLNSPRSREYKNGDFENLMFTKRIDNKVARLYRDYEFSGFGDFGGLKDDLPIDAAGNGMGAALGLIYLKEQNAFYSIVNYNTSEGMRGFRYVRSEVLNRLQILDIGNDCVAIKRIREMDGKYGNWGTWTNLTLTRYIHQQAKK
jgi:hypothetical protein